MRMRVPDLKGGVVPEWSDGTAGEKRGGVGDRCAKAYGIHVSMWYRESMFVSEVGVVSGSE